MERSTYETNDTVKRIEAAYLITAIFTLGAVIHYYIPSITFLCH